MKKQVKFSIDEVNRIIGQYVCDKNLLGDVKCVDIIFRVGEDIKDSFVIVTEK